MLLPLLAVGAGLTYELFNVFRERGFLGALQGRYLFSALIPFPSSSAALDFVVQVATHRVDLKPRALEFIGALYAAAKGQKRVTAEEKAVENEKFAFRVFLIRLGFVVLLAGFLYRKKVFIRI